MCDSLIKKKKKSEISNKCNSKFWRQATGTFELITDNHGDGDYDRVLRKVKVEICITNKS